MTAPSDSNPSSLKDRYISYERRQAKALGVPTIGLEDDDVEDMDIHYSHRGPDDWVLGGPLGLEMVESNRPGRWFETWEEAEVWVRSVHGDKVKGRKPSEPGDTRSWAFIIRGPRGG